MSDNHLIQGVPVVVSGPSGVGKGTIIKRLLERTEKTVLSISMTTRPPRPGEEEGVNYFFVSKQQFEEHIRHGALLEWAKVYENYYGTPKENLEAHFRQGNDVIVEIDVQGAASAKMHYKNGLFIYILPPSIDVLKQRLYSRAKGEGDDLNHRLSQAKQEMQFLDLYDYAVINDDLDKAVNQAQNIILADRQRYARQRGHLQALGLSSFAV